MRFIWKGQTLWLSERRCIFWEEQKMLIFSDPHFGKAAHFRKSGIQIPQKVSKDNLFTLFELIEFFHPEKVLITGDLFHSSENKETDIFLQWRKQINHLPVILVKGNHDILGNPFYQEANIEIKEAFWCVENFCFTHDIESVSSTNYIFSGHIHPAVRVVSGSKQSLKLPCFYFGRKFAILPAFGRFTGTAVIQPSKGEPVFGITKNEVIRLQ